MKTCAYCGTELKTSYCSFCEMELDDHYILEDGNRLSNTTEFFPEMQGIFKSTRELLQLETIELLCLLRHARNFRTDVYKLRLLSHQAASHGGNVVEIEKASYNDYEEATRKVWAIENIIKDRVGYYPQKITEEFLSMYLERIEKSQKKKMTIKKKINS